MSTPKDGIGGDGTGGRDDVVAEADSAEAGTAATVGAAGTVGVAGAASTVGAGGQVRATGLNRPVDWLLVVLITVLSGCVAVVGLAFLPLYIGVVPVPISALLGVAAMILAPRACYALTGSLLAAALPVLSWFGVSVVLVLSRNPMMPQLPLTVIGGQWRVMVLLGLGSLAAAATLGLLWGDRLRQRIAAERPAADPAGDPAHSRTG